MWLLWSLVSGLSAAAPPQNPQCAAAVSTEIQAKEAAHQALQQTVDQAKATPGITQLTSELQTLTNVWAYHERSAATVDQITTSRSDANLQIELLLTQLEAQWAVDKAVHIAERDHMRSAIALQQATCAATPCSEEPTCAGESDGATAKVLAQVTELYDELSRNEDSFHNRHSYQVLLGRVRGGGVAERHVGTDQARAAWLLSYLAVSTVRPSRARARVAGFLSEVGGRPQISPDHLRYGRHLLVWATDRERRLRKLDGGIDNLIDSWVKLDLSRTTDSRRPNVALAVQKLRRHDSAPPPPMASFL